MLKVCAVLLCMFLTGSLFGCEDSSDVVVPVNDDDVVIVEENQTGKDVFMQYQLYPTRATEYADNSRDVYNELAAQLFWLPTSYSSIEVYELSDTKVSVSIKLELTNGYYTSGEVMTMVLDQVESVLYNSYLSAIEYNVDIDFEDGCEYFESYPNNNMYIDSGYGAYSTMRK